VPRFPSVLVFLALSCASAPTPMPLDAVFERPEGVLPHRFAFSPDGKRLAYLKPRAAGGLSDLWVLDVGRDEHALLLRAEGPETLTPEERAARERRRDRVRGIGRYWWNPDSKRILLALSGDLFVLDAGQLERITETEAPERNPRWSPDGRSIAFVRDQDVWVWRDGREMQLTTGGGGTVTCGLAEFIAAEELGRHAGFWWSPDSRSIAYVRFDARDVPVFRMHDYLPAYGKTIEQRYPRAGDPNVTWDLFVAPVDGGPHRRVPVEDEYLVRVDWKRELTVLVSDRAQRRMRLLDAAGDLLHEETDGAWVDRPYTRLLPDGRLLRTSGRALYLGDRELLDGVARVAAVGERDALVTASPDDPRRRRVWRVPFDGAPSVAFFAPWCGVAAATEDGRRSVVTHSAAGRPPTIELVDGASRRVLARSVDLDLPKPEWREWVLDDGTALHGMLYRARRSSPGPAIVFCYGGPGSQLVADRWGGATYLWHMRMLAKGYTILTVDGRGAGGYGRDFSRVVSGRLCDYEVRDQAAAARMLARDPIVDPARIGIWGWSYGGTLTLMCLLHRPDVFAAGVAVAPVTDWRDYDTAYTERYLGLPAGNAEGYALSSPITAAATLKRPLFLAHGFQDDNVHFRGAVAFLDAAQKAGAVVETDFYPRGAHGIGGKRERKLLFRRMEEFWDRVFSVR